MLKKINRSDLREGMRFSAPVFFDDGESMLVSQGVPFKSRELSALDRWKISYVLTAGREISADEAAMLEKAAKKNQNAPADELEALEEIDDAEELDAMEELDEADSDDGVNGSPLAEKATLDKLQYTSEQILKLPEVLEHNELYAKYYSP